MSFEPRRATGLAAALLLAFGIAVSPAFALSEIKPGDPQAPAAETSEDAPPETTAPAEGGVPAPETIEKTPLPEATPTAPAETTPAAPGAETPAAPAPEGPAPEEEAAPEEGEPAEDGAGQSTRPDPDAPVPPINYDIESLPVPVKSMRRLILEATKTGDIENLRPLIGVGNDITQLSLGGIEGDPVDFLKELSGDDQGQEILAILEEVLSAGFVHLDAGKPEELYVWPYFFAVPLENLTPPQRVELFKIVTAGDYEDMKSYGAYIFYRVGISPEGRWIFFVAGD
ncbi:MAG TPA: hypothetical protein VMF90_21295 [Rhizobiaceae bacterium]|nr:hypothetical protein [Rhizobiaceae bacterium]